MDMHGSAMLAGVTSVACPACLARIGRPCTNRRGYLLTGGAHGQRRAAWLAAERAEHREVTERDRGPDQDVVGASVPGARLPG